MPSLFTVANCFMHVPFTNEQLVQNHWFCYTHKQRAAFKGEILDQNGILLVALFTSKPYASSLFYSLVLFPVLLGWMEDRLA